MSVAPSRPQRPAELDQLDALLADAGPGVTQRVLCEVAADDVVLPVVAVMLGNPDPGVPAVGFFGGVHGLERIGVDVVLAYLSTLVARLRWDVTLHHQLERMRMVFVPLVNPGGLWQGTRANPQGVDLMRNSPVECSHGAPFLLGGQRLSAALPWYRGPSGAPMQPEAQALCDVVQSELLSHRFAMALDCHSGFGMSDRLWFPHANTPLPVEHLPELHALDELLDATLLHHRYVFEPQSRQYLAHGDLWDHLYLRALDTPDRVLLPLTLEMGSWLWVKKNPRQFFSLDGIFNPSIRHREERVLRRHLGLLDFFARAACSHANWLPAPQVRAQARERALDRWYRGVRIR
ncbi:MAG: M14 family zinc carboxypeptidase [Rhizobacter sp.]